MAGCGLRERFNAVPAAGREGELGKSAVTRKGERGFSGEKGCGCMLGSAVPPALAPARRMARGRVAGGFVCGQVRRAARGLCLWKVWYGWRSPRTARASPDDVRIRQAAPRSTRSRLIHLPLFRALRPDCSGRDRDRPREWFSGNRHGPCRAARGASCPPQARTGHCRLPPPLRRRKRSPARWLALHGHLRPPASGTPMASASCHDLPHVPADPDRPSSRLVRYVRDPSGGGSGHRMARTRRVGMKWGEGFGQGVGIVGGGVGEFAPDPFPRPGD